MGIAPPAHSGVLADCCPKSPERFVYQLTVVPEGLITVARTWPRWREAPRSRTAIPGSPPRRTGPNVPPALRDGFNQQHFQRRDSVLPIRHQTCCSVPEALSVVYRLRTLFLVVALAWLLDVRIPLDDTWLTFALPGGQPHRTGSAESAGRDGSRASSERWRRNSASAGNLIISARSRARSRCQPVASTSCGVVAALDIRRR